MNTHNEIHAGKAVATLAGGCFWCLEAVYEGLRGVESVVSGYMGGTVPNPTYEAVCTGTTGHAEVVQLTYDPAVLSFKDILEVFFTIHDPTTLNRQGNDVGTQYRSGIYYYSDEQRREAEAAARSYEAALRARGFAPVTTEILTAPTFYFAEDYHQQYLAKVPNGYCPNHATGVTLEGPIVHMEQV